jgi:hypothetical protein
MEGWIKLHRKVIDHWIYKDPLKFHWWIDILLMVNHEDNKVNIGFELFDCKRGQSIMSLKNWADRWNINKDTARNFLKLLEKDGMIIHENLSKTTRLTVCNYEDYQVNLHDKQTTNKRQTNARQTQSDPNKNDKNDKEYIYNQFYDLELQNTNDENYKKLVAFIFGENPTSEPLKKVIGIEKQISYVNFCDLMGLATKHNKKLLDEILSLENYTPKKPYSSVYLTLRNWIKS